MKKRKLLWFFAFAALFLLNIFITIKYINKVKKVNASVRILDEISSDGQFATSSNPFPSNGYQTNAQLTDGRVANLKQFFRKYNSPLYDKADIIVKTSDKYNFDYRLLPAIAMQESGLCQTIPSDSYNCWGWGIYGDKVARFSSYDEAIDAVGNGIREEYINKGLVTATMIMEKYTPSSNGSWARAVNTFMRVLE